MPTPKSVTKIKSDGVEYVSNVDACEYYIFELTRAALRDVAKFVKREFKEKFYQNFNKISGDAGRATSAKVWSSANTKSPRVEIGFKTGKVDGFYAYFQEFGTSTGIPALGLLQHAVEDNVDTIIEIESKYLSGLEGEAEALIESEGDYDIEEDEE